MDGAVTDGDGGQQVSIPHLRVGCRVHAGTEGGTSSSSIARCVQGAVYRGDYTWLIFLTQSFLTTH